MATKVQQRARRLRQLERFVRQVYNYTCDRNDELNGLGADRLDNAEYCKLMRLHFRTVELMVEKKKNENPPS